MWSTYLGREPLDLGVRDFFRSLGDSDPTNPKKRDVIVTLADVSVIVVGVKTKPASVWVIWSPVTSNS